MKALVIAVGFAISASTPALTLTLMTGLTVTLAAEAALIVRSLRRKLVAR